MKHKKTIAFALTFFIALLSIFPATAAVVDASGTISPCYSGLISFTADLWINNGVAACSGNATAKTSYTVDVTMELQKHDDSWQTIKTWTGSGNNVSLDKIRYVESGYDYRVKVTANVYNSSGILIESPSTCSGIVYY